MTTIGKVWAEELLDAAVAEKGSDYVYPVGNPYAGYTTCKYTRADKPSCIVGNALTRAGVPLAVLKAIDHGGAIVPEEYDSEGDPQGEMHLVNSMESTGIDERDVNYWLGRNGWVLTEGAKTLFKSAQHAQDNGIEWGKAVAQAKHSTKEYI